MDTRVGRDVVRRWVDNPLIALEDLPFRSGGIWNAGITRFDGEYVMLLTIETLEGRYCIYQARGRDGQHFWIDDKPFMAPNENGPYETLGIRDPRITHLDETYYITYVAEGDHGLRLGLARTDDFQCVDRMGFISQVDTKNGVLLPKKIGGRYAMLTRPAEGGSIWLAYSEDLVFWGDQTVVMTPRGGHWDADLIGASAPPIEIDQGWLLIYYGEKRTSAGPLVRLGAAILDADDPASVVARSNIPILAPRERYERMGDVPNVVFSCGVQLADDGMVNIYYGASDSCIALGQAPLDEIVRVCLESGKEF